MIIGATVFAALILLLLLAERGSAVLWRDGAGERFFYCTPCDLRYPAVELGDDVRQVCPRGHVVEPAPQGFPFSTFLICLCTVFVALGALLALTGQTP